MVGQNRLCPPLSSFLFGRSHSRVPRASSLYGSPKKQNETSQAHDTQTKETCICPILDSLVCLAVCFSLSVPSVCLFWIHHVIHYPLCYPLSIMQALCSWNEISYIKLVLYHYCIIVSSLLYCMLNVIDIIRMTHHGNLALLWVYFILGKNDFWAALWSE